MHGRFLLYEISLRALQFELLKIKLMYIFHELVRSLIVRNFLWSAFYYAEAQKEQFDFSWTFSTFTFEKQASFTENALLSHLYKSKCITEVFCNSVC